MQCTTKVIEVSKLENLARSGTGSDSRAGLLDRRIRNDAVKAVFGKLQFRPQAQ